MQLHQLQPIHKKKNEKRIGRGGKRGTYSGRGQKGQRARAGHRLPKVEREMISKLPKLRGIKNKPLRAAPIILQLGSLEKKFPDALVINKKVLREAEVIKRLSQHVKILGEGEVKKALTIDGIAISKSAREKIEKAGGTIK